MKTQVTKAKIIGAKTLFEEIADRLSNRHATEGNGIVKTDEFEMAGLMWEAQANIESHCKEITSRDNPPEYVITDASCTNVIIEAADKEGNAIEVDFFDEAGKAMSDDDLTELIILMVSDQY